MEKRHGWAFGWEGFAFHASVENLKRRRSLPPASFLDRESRLFFEKILSVKQEHELVFVPKPHAKRR